MSNKLFHPTTGATRPEFKVRRINFEPFTYYLSQLDDNRQRIDISSHFRYLTEKEIQACTGRLAKHLAKLHYKADKITESLKDERATSGFPRTCLKNKFFASKADIRSL